MMNKLCNPLLMLGENLLSKKNKLSSQLEKNYTGIKKILNLFLMLNSELLMNQWALLTDQDMLKPEYILCWKNWNISNTNYY